MTLTLSDEECSTIRAWWPKVAEIIAWPDRGIGDVKAARAGGGDIRIVHEARKTGLWAAEHNVLPVPSTTWNSWQRTGGYRWECLITWKRLRQWRDSLPAEVVETAKKCRKPDGDIGFVNSPEARSWRWRAVEMAIEASRPQPTVTTREPVQLALFGDVA